MKFIGFVFFLIISTIIMPGYARSSGDIDISLSSAEIARGDVILVDVKTGEGDKPRITWLNKEIATVYNNLMGSWQGFIAADLTQKKGVYNAAIRIPSSGFEKTVKISVIDKDYGVRKLTLPKEKVELDAESLKRVNKEAAVVSALWSAGDHSPEWKGRFLLPVDGDVIGIFGKRSIINNLERSPHTGVDQQGETGNPVKSINNGKIALVADHFFTGNSVYIDHGGGIISMYFHLDKILVKEGDNVERGQVIGLVGSTGRVTGPHLHWGMRVNGARVNPLTLIDLSRGLEE
jgi:murein DD-endopeptidase MepM/ murein hydrolase activator NlpD